MEEGAVVTEELTQGGSEDLGLEDGSEGVNLWDAVGRREGAVEYDVVPGVPCGAPVGVIGVRVGKVRARACGGVVSPRAEFVRIVSIEAVSDGEAEDGG